MTPGAVEAVTLPSPSAAGDSGLDSEVLLHRRRVFILPTRYGVSFGLVLFVMLVGSVNYNNSLGYMLTFLLGSLGLVSILHTYRNLSGLMVRGGRVKPVFVGNEASFPLCLHNPGASDRRAILLGYQGGTGTAGAQRSVLSTAVPANKVQCVELKVRATHRGWLPLGEVILATRYPLGFVRAWSRVQLAAGCVVYPRAAGRQPLPRVVDFAAKESGVRGSGSSDFVGFRDYHPGDSPRQIHWKAVARELGMPVKLFLGGSAGDLQLRWEDAMGDTESRLSQLCQWLLEAHRRGHRYALVIPGTTIGSGSDESHLNRCLEALAMYGTRRD